MQGSLFELPEPKTTDRLFFAIYPDPAIAQERIAPLATALRTAQRLHGKILRTERFHVTLHHLGDFAELPQQLVQAACAAAASLTWPCFDVAFDRAESFDNKRNRNNPFVLQGGEQGTAEVIAFQRALGEALRSRGLKPDGRFTPHLTLLYDDKVVPAQPVEPPVRWTAQEVVLVHSLIGQSIHIPLGRWPLR